LVGKSEGKRPHRRPNIRMALREIGWEGVDWFHLAEGKDQCWPLLNMVMNFWVP